MGKINRKLAQGFTMLPKALALNSGVSPYSKLAFLAIKMHHHQVRGQSNQYNSEYVFLSKSTIYRNYLGISAAKLDKAIDELIYMNVLTIEKKVRSTWQFYFWVHDVDQWLLPGCVFANRAGDGFVKVPNELIGTPGLDVWSKAVYTTIACHCSNKGKRRSIWSGRPVGWPSISTIAAETNCSPRTVNDRKVVLKQAGLVDFRRSHIEGSYGKIQKWKKSVYCLLEPDHWHLPEVRPKGVRKNAKNNCSGNFNRGAHNDAHDINSGADMAWEDLMAGALGQFTGAPTKETTLNETPTLTVSESNVPFKADAPRSRPRGGLYFQAMLQQQVEGNKEKGKSLGMEKK